MAEPDTISTFGERLEDLRHDERLSITDFAEHLDVSRSTYYGWRKMKEPTREAVGAVVSAFRTVSVDWLHSGKGEMKMRAAQGDGAVQMPTTSGNELLLKGNYPDDGETGILTVYLDTDIQAGCGSGGFCLEGVEDSSVQLRYIKQYMYDLLGVWLPDDVEALRAAGRSMEPTFHDGQILLYKPVPNLGGIVNLRRYIISIQNPVTDEWTPLAKRLHVRANGGFRIISDNKSAGEPDVILQPQKNGSFRRSDTGEEVRMAVLGEVVWPKDGRRGNGRSAEEMLEVLIQQGIIEQH